MVKVNLIVFVLFLLLYCTPKEFRKAFGLPIVGMCAIASGVSIVRELQN